MRLHYLQHVPFEDPAGIFHWAEARGVPMTRSRLYDTPSLPVVADFDALLIMGGPMNIYEDDRYRWLGPEKRLIAEAITAGRIVVGICLGAQLIADALGAPVQPNLWREIGWLPVRRSESAGVLGGALPAVWEAVHWHGDTFELPEGALHLASSTACARQAFVYDDRVLALQFHLETTPDSARALIAHCGHEIDGGPFVQTAAGMLADPARFARANALLYRLMDRLCGFDP
ncbi:MAG: type 1 glutamine amidotransferase [Desulfobacteraceae bacterium]|jgi:GMP synthase (glutamine-hydrolysing)|nr:type 1 glutamine amidotransferase [Desulfobacteraceae bacterium]